MSGLNFDITEQKEIEDTHRAREERPDWARQASPGLTGRSFSEVMAEQAEARRRLALSEACFRTVFENAAAGMAQVGPGGALLAVNKRLCEMLGYSAAELLTKRFHDITHPEDLEANLTYVQRLLDGVADTYSMEKRYQRKDGSIFWARLTAGCLRKADRAVDFFINVVQDISERKRAEIALRESEERLAAALRAGKLGVYDYDPRTGLIEWDSTLRQIWGVPAGETVTLETFEAGLHPEDLAPVRAAMSRSYEPDGTRHYDAEYRVINRVDGSVRWVFADGDVFFDGETPCRMVGIARDITESRRAKDRLRESEERLAAALRAGKLGVHDYDPRTGLIKWDATLRRLWGVSDGEIVTIETLKPAFHPDDLATVREAIARSFDPDGTRHYEGEYRVVNRIDGSIRWVFADGDVSFDGETPCRIVGIAQDITERKNAKEALRESEKRLRYALNAASAGIWDWDIRSGNAHWSPEDYALYGREQTGAPVTYSDWESCLHPDDREAANLAVSRALAGEVPEYRNEFRVIHPDGTVRWLLALGQVDREADGTPSRMVGINLDITERKLTDEALRASEERYRGIFQNAGTGIAIADLDGHFQSCNPAYTRMIGYSLDELHALSFPDLVHPADREENLLQIRRLIAQEISSFEFVNRKIGKHGKPIWVHKHVSLLRDRAGTPASIISLVTDITERKQHEEQIALLLREVTHRLIDLLPLCSHRVAHRRQDAAGVRAALR